MAFTPNLAIKALHFMAAGYRLRHYASLVAMTDKQPISESISPQFTYLASSAGGHEDVDIAMTGLRPLMLCLWALANTALWAIILYSLNFVFGLTMNTAEGVGVLVTIFVFTFVALRLMGASQDDPDADR